MGKDFSEECIDSLMEQTFSNFEIILVDNGSADGSAEWVEERYGISVRLFGARRTSALPEDAMQASIWQEGNILSYSITTRWWNQDGLKN